MDVESRPPVTNQPSIPPPPYDAALSQVPSTTITTTTTTPSHTTSNNVTTISEPVEVLDRPRDKQDDEVAKDKPAETSAKPLPLPASPFSLNLISAFGLDPLAATVARFDPTSGEKINKMRKSYENYLKKFDLLGKNRAVKHEEAVATGGGQKMMSLNEVVAWPEEEWQMQRVHGKDVKKGLSEALKGKLEKALTMNPGPNPDQTKWDDILGVDRTNSVATNSKSRKDGLAANGQPSNHVNAATTGAAVNTNHSNPGAGGEHIRARRNTKKRRYDDGSFEGYGEGFVDDEMENDGYESGETYTSRNSRGSKGDRKRRKTQDFGKAGPSGASRTASFASGYGR